MDLRSNLRRLEMRHGSWRQLCRVGMIVRFWRGFPPTRKPSSFCTLIRGLIAYCDLTGATRGMKKASFQTDGKAHARGAKEKRWNRAAAKYMILDTGPRVGGIVDVEASRAIRQAEVGAAKTMIERAEERFSQAGAACRRCCLRGSSGADWLVEEKGIAPLIPVFDKGNRKRSPRTWSGRRGAWPFLAR